jgi:hypothetical protein
MTHIPHTWDSCLIPNVEIHLIYTHHLNVPHNKPQLLTDRRPLIHFKGGRASLPAFWTRRLRNLLRHLAAQVSEAHRWLDFINLFRDFPNLIGMLRRRSHRQARIDVEYGSSRIGLASSTSSTSSWILDPGLRRSWRIVGLRRWRVGRRRSSSSRSLTCSHTWFRSLFASNSLD